MKIGAKDKCRQCGRVLECVGSWRHVGEQPRHRAQPSLNQENQEKEELEELTKKLKRWAEIAQLTFEKENWDKCSLLHSFGDALARDLREAIKFIERVSDVSA